MPRLLRAGALLLLALLAGCGSTAGRPAASPTVPPANIQAIVAASTLVAGSNRLPIGIVVDGTPINDPQAKVHLRFYYLDDPAQSQNIAGETDAIYFGDKLPFGVYVAYPEIPKAGAWRVEVQMLVPNKPAAVSNLRLDVLATDPTPPLGSQAIAVDSPTGATPEELKKITSAPDPDPALYKLSVADALAQRKPLAILFGTPGFCKTATCGPSIAVMSQLQRAYGDRMNFIHVESYAYPFGESAQASPPKLSAGMEEWGLFSEPWVYLIDGSGVVRAKYEGGITLDELTPVIENLLKTP
ncbi:MAG TPA: hypothetical protein VGE07_10575 [Herpetosiphonaceae bacterium]